MTDSQLNTVLAKTREREVQKQIKEYEESPRPQGWFSKILPQSESSK